MPCVVSYLHVTARNEPVVHISRARMSNSDDMLVQCAECIAV